MGALSLTNSKIKQRAGFGPLLPDGPPRALPARPRLARADRRRRHRPSSTTCATRSSAARSRRRTSRPSWSSRSRARAATSPLRASSSRACASCVTSTASCSSPMRSSRAWAAPAAGGRSSTMGVEPDIITTAKGIASGMPIGAFIARDSVWTWPPGAHGSTFAGNPVCAAAGAGDPRHHRGRRARQRQRHGRPAASRARASRVRDRMRCATSAAPASCSASSSTRTRRRRRSRTRPSVRGLLTLECGESSLRFSPPLIVDAAVGRHRHPHLRGGARRSRAARRRRVAETGGCRPQFSRSERLVSLKPRSRRPGTMSRSESSVS